MDIKIISQHVGLKLILVALLGFSALPTESASTVYWGGVSFASWDDRQALFPNVAKFLCRGGGDCVDTKI